MLKVSELKCLNFTSNILETITNSNSNEKILEILNNKFALSKLKAYILIMSKNCVMNPYKQIDDKIHQLVDSHISEYSMNEIEIFCFCGEILEDEIKIFKNLKFFKEVKLENIYSGFDYVKEDFNDKFNKLIQPLNSTKTVSFISMKNKLKNKNSVNKNYNLQLAQKKLKLKDFTGNLEEINYIDNSNLTSIRVDKKLSDRYHRTLWVIFIVLTASLICFTLIKSAVDCASNSKTALNRMNDSHARDIQEKLSEENLIRESLSNNDLTINKVKIFKIKMIANGNNSEINVNIMNSNNNLNKLENKKESIKINKEIEEMNGNELFKSVSFFKLEYSLADKKDILLISFACLGSVIAGASMPLISLLLGKVINQFDGKIAVEKVPELVHGLIINFLLAGIAIFIGSFMMVLFWSLVGRRLINKINADYFRVIMQQDQSWFDSSNMYQFASKVQIGNKVGQALMSLSQFIVSFLVGYITSWKLSIVITAMLPLLGLGGWCMAMAMEQGSSNRRTYEKAGGMAEEVLYNIKTVASFANFEEETSKYQFYLNTSLKAGIKSGFKTGFGIGFIVFVIYCSYALAVGYGSNLIANQYINSNSGNVFGGGDVITVLFSIIFGCFSLGQGAPNIKAIYDATSAAREYFDLKERKPKVNMEQAIEKPNKEHLVGEVQFDKVTFSYPSKPDHFVLKSVDIIFEPCKKTAIVGSSGCGKSTILSLIERFYLPNQGTIKLDGHDINNIDLFYWRSLIGYVPQEPVLFNNTIKNNIIFGRDEVTDNEINEAIEKAYATEFISNLGIDYMVGIKGSKLSGGQKQRIAIARAILNKPKLLILDEATSALDNNSEKEVQKALDVVSQGITTIIIAHKLETIKNSDKILFLKEGYIIESGTHDELIKIKNGAYSEMIKSELQTKNKKKSHHISSLNDKIVEEVEGEGLHNHICISDQPYMSPGKMIIPDSDIKLRKVTSKNKYFEDVDLSKSEENHINIQKKYTKILNVELSPDPLTPKKPPSFKKEGKQYDSFNDNSKSNHVIQPNNKQNQQEVDPEKFKSARRRLLALLKGEKCFVAGGMTAAACNGAVWPIYGILLADAIGVLSLKTSAEVLTGGLNVAMMFLGLAISAAIVLWMQNYFFYGIGEILTKKFRELIFEKFLNFHMGFFDRIENSPGSLITKLSSETTKINGVATSIIGQLIQTSVTLILGISIGLVYQWKLCLINICFMPLIIGNYIIQFRVSKGSEQSVESIEIEAGSILSESVINTKSIFSYNMSDKVVEFYSKILSGLNKDLLKSSSINGLLYAISQFVIFGMYATLFYVGGNLYSAGETTLQYMMRAIFTILFTALGVGIAQAFVGDYKSAKEAIVSLYNILDEPSLIDVAETEVKGLKKANYDGKIEFRNVKFAYPSRPNNLIFKGLNFIINPGQNVAFVGASGSGKSTIISLIERFYDVNSGQVLIDDVDIKEYDLKMLRKNIGLVMQEPILFQRSIKENINYGRLEATSEEVTQAAKDAFIDDLLNEKDNKDLNVSGGQKQRVAIARAILKCPKILLLDEATSALDSNAEELVKQSLNILMKNRTSIIIAHRLSTIVHCDIIFVLENGVIVEQGTHDFLINLKGKYFNLYSMNSN